MTPVESLPDDVLRRETPKKRARRTPEVVPPSIGSEPQGQEARPTVHVTATPEVAEFLKGQPLLRSLIEESRAFIESCFGKSATATTRLTTDPEDDEETVAVLIQTEDGWRADSERLRRFKECWWYRAAPQTQGRLTFKVGFE